MGGSVGDADGFTVGLVLGYDTKRNQVAHLETVSNSTVHCTGKLTVLTLTLFVGYAEGCLVGVFVGNGVGSAVGEAVGSLVG